MSAPNYELTASPNSYTEIVTVSDGVNSVTQSISISVNDINDPPGFFSSASRPFTAMENQTSADSRLNVYDVERDELTCSISGSEITLTDATYFPGNDSPGSTSSLSSTLTFNTAPDYETKDTYTATVTCSDGALSASKDIIVNIRLDDSQITRVGFTAADIGSCSNGCKAFLVPENQTAIGSAQVTFVDLNGDQSEYWPTVLLSTDNIPTQCGGPQIAHEENITISIDGVLSFINAPDHETKTNYQTNLWYSHGPDFCEGLRGSTFFEVEITDVAE